MLHKIFLNRLKGPGPAQKRALVKAVGGFENAFLAIREGEAFAQSVSKQLITETLEEAKKLEAVCLQKGIYITDFTKFGLPEFPDLPLLLYCRGDWKPMGESIGIVGTRRCSEYGKKITTETAERLAADGVTVISGMAKGIDGYAHTAALKAGGYTVAVLGNGPDICFPSEHASLMESILKTGLIISEYPPGFHGDRSTFPQRNRIIAAFSDRLLVVESGDKGGALITAEKARQYGKEVFAVPGRLDSAESTGTNRLIAENRAKLWLPEYRRSDNIQPKFNFVKERRLGEKERNSAISHISPKSELLSIIQRHNGRIAVFDLSNELGVDAKNVMASLTELEINGIIETEGDMVWLL